MTINEGLIPDQLHQYPFAPAPIELPIENLLPRAEIETALGNCDNNFSPHDLTFQVRIAVILAGLIVAVATQRRMGREFLKPPSEILMESALIIINED